LSHSNHNHGIPPRRAAPQAKASRRGDLALTDPIAWSIGIAVVLGASALSIWLLCRIRPKATLADAARALATPLRVILHRDSSGP
jgi:hypothetical protein